MAAQNSKQFIYLKYVSLGFGIAGIGIAIALILLALAK
jgi:hypothetical protein